LPGGRCAVAPRRSRRRWNRGFGAPRYGPIPSAPGRQFLTVPVV
jgi:hypothetical protein